MVETVITVGSVAGSVIGKIKAFHDFYTEFKDNDKRCDLLDKRLELFAKCINKIKDHNLHNQNGPFILALQRLEDTVDKATAYAVKYKKKKKIKQFIWTMAIKRKFAGIHEELNVFEATLRTVMGLDAQVHDKATSEQLEKHNKDICEKLDQLKDDLNSYKIINEQIPRERDFTDYSVAPEVPHIAKDVIQVHSPRFDTGSSCHVYEGTWNEERVAVKQLLLPERWEQRGIMLR